MATKKTEKKAFPEELSKQLETKRASKKTKTIEKETMVTTQEVVESEDNVMVITDAVIENPTVVYSDLSGETSSVETTYHQEPVVGEEAPEKENKEDVTAAEENHKDNLETDAVTTDDVLVEETKSTEVPPVQEVLEIEKLVQEVTEKNTPETVKPIKDEKPKEKVKPSRKEMDYYNDRFANTWSGMQFDW